MTQLVVNQDDSFERMLKGCKRKVQEAGILMEALRQRRRRAW